MNNNMKTEKNDEQLSTWELMHMKKKGEKEFIIIHDDNESFSIFAKNIEEAERKLLDKFSIYTLEEYEEEFSEENEEDEE